MPPEEDPASGIIRPSRINSVRNSIETAMLTVDELIDKAELALGEEAALELLYFAIDKKVPPNHKNEIVEFLKTQDDMTSNLCLAKLTEINS